MEKASLNDVKNFLGSLVFSAGGELETNSFVKSFSMESDGTTELVFCLDDGVERSATIKVMDNCIGL